MRDVLSVMASCGMYDFAGEWLVSVGLPAKSGVSGGVFAVLPGRLGICVFSPRVDAQGNSVRGVDICRELSHDLAVHFVRPGERQAPPLRAVYHLGERGSKREALAREIEEPADPPELVVVDLGRVVRADRGGTRFIRALAENIVVRGGRMAPAPSRGVVEHELADLPESVLVFDELDLALEWCEDELLRRTGEQPVLTELPLAEHELLAGLSAADLAHLPPALGEAAAEAGSLLVREGAEATELFLVTHGTLSGMRTGTDGERHRLTTVSAGMTFGELAFVDRRPRAADVCADFDVVCATLSYATIDALALSDPALHARLLHNILAVVVASLRVVNAEVLHLRS